MIDRVSQLQKICAELALADLEKLEPCEHVHHFWGSW
jgi:hypothetical protein